MPMRVVLRLRDGQILSGYTPAFDPLDGSIWLSPAPDSPAGTMVAIDRVQVLVLESNDGRPVPLPGSAVRTDPSGAISISFQDQEPLIGRHKADAPGLGLWLQPAGRAFARAFVPLSAGPDIDEATDAEADAAGDDQHGWGFSVSASGLVSTSGTPTDGTELPTVPPLGRDSMNDTMPLDFAGQRPTLEAPPVPPGWTPPERTGSATESTAEMPMIEIGSKTDPDLEPPKRDD
ncbi:MAG: hypothetical protein IT384_17185 [Deltaproteobacteria bacterium]|nr:hypothetical protein [Deltaproteobacteria bacterium]